MSDMAEFPFLRLNIPRAHVRVCVYVYVLHFMHSSIDRYLGCSHILAIINNAAVNTRVQIPLR